MLEKCVGIRVIKSIQPFERHQKNVNLTSFAVRHLRDLILTWVGIQISLFHSLFAFL